MKKNLLFAVLFLIIQFTFWGCKKEFIGENAEITISSVIEITDTTAVFSFRINNSGGTPVTESGICWSTYNLPTVSDNKTVNSDTTIDLLTITLFDLNPNTIYYARAYATNKAGTSYSDVMSFCTLEKGTVADIDGNIYHTVKIGNQTWMVENLRTTKYNDGTQIPLLQNSLDWNNSTTGSYCYMYNVISYLTNYGAYYNFYAVKTGKLAPKGWHVATKEEWDNLEVYLTNNGFGVNGNGNGVATAIASTSGWNPSSEIGDVGYFQAGNNLTGFTGLPTGYRYLGFYLYEGIFSTWWTSTEENQTNAYIKYLYNENEYIQFAQTSKNYGYSVRCIKN